jgi:hypothetical protein
MMILLLLVLFEKSWDYLPWILAYVLLTVILIIIGLVIWGVADRSDEMPKTVEGDLELRYWRYLERRWTNGLMWILLFGVIGFIIAALLDRSDKLA